MRTGYFRGFGGRFVPELLIQPLVELEEAWRQSLADTAFQAELEDLLAHYAGRPTPLTEAVRYGAALGGPRLFLKREDLLHTGAHKLNNALGQCLLARAMGKRAVIAETGAGQHGLATATACARLGLECTVFMGSVDMDRQRPNVDKMLLLGARVVRVEQGSATLKEAVNESLREWAAAYETTHYCLGSALGPHPFPSMVASFQAVIGREAKRQVLERTGRPPDLCVACVGGGSNSIGLFSAFLLDEGVALVGVEAGGTGPEPGRHAARFLTGSPGILHGSRTFVLQDGNGQILGTHSISAGLDYPAVGPEHAALHELGRVTYVSVADREALGAFKNLSRSEGIIPALETSHALAWVERHAAEWKDKLVLVCLSGRGDKDLPALRGML